MPGAFPAIPDDAEDDTEDCCEAGDDDVRSGLSPSHQFLQFPIDRIGDDVDGEPECPPIMDHLEQEKARA